MKSAARRSTSITVRIILSSLLLTGACWLFCPVSQAEVPPRTLEDLQKEADVIVTGKVRRIKRSRSTDSAKTVRRHYTITVNVNRVEKGSAIANDRQVVAHGYQVIGSILGWAGATGQYRGPNKQRLSVLRFGSPVRLYLKAKRDGTYDIVLPNGFEPLK